MKKAELVFIPLPAMGHVVPIVQLANQLVDLNSNLYITVLTVKLPGNAKLNAYIDSLAVADASTSRIKFINLSQYDTDEDAFKFQSNFVQMMELLVKEFVSNIVEHSNSVPDSPPLAGFVHDIFLTSSLVDLANELGVPNYAFFTSGAGSLGFHLYTQALHDEQKIEFDELKDLDTEFTIPSYVNAVSIKLFPNIPYFPATFTFFRNLMKRIREVKGILINTFSELESHAIDSLSNAKLQIPPIYLVGPLLNLEGSSKVHQNYDSIMQWLDEQPPSSVVFLCFGSAGCFGTNQVKEIAYALEQSGHRFLWSLRRPEEAVKGIMRIPTDYENMAEVLPEGFLDRTADIGKVIGWAPQAAILGHPATGGFVSHCGWNSTLESIWFGVPMVAWPLFAEQQLNALTLVEELGLAVEIKMDYRNHGDEIEIINAEKIEREIKRMMKPDSDVRLRMKRMSDHSKKALMEGGSSHATLCRFINNIMDNIA